MLLAAAVSILSTVGPLPNVAFNDNRLPAGRLEAGVLHLELDIVQGEWRPNGMEHAGATVLSFALRGQGPSTPGPLIRVREGTVVRASVRNTTDEPIAVHGLANRRGMAILDSLVVAPGAEETASFTADREGTFFYWGARPGTALDDRLFDDALLNGALVVDPATGPVAADRILLIDVYTDRVPGDSGLEEAGEILSINGRPWPHTERMEATVDDSIRWRLINASYKDHPMHLHGFYFRVDAAGDWQDDTLFDPRARRMAVTENMHPGTTRRIVWSPNRPGGWLFHCHLSFHAAMNAPLGAEWPGGQAYAMKAYFAPNLADAAHHVEDHMGGLMLVTRVKPKGPIPARVPAERTIRLDVIATADSIPMMRTYGYRIDDGTKDAKPGEAPLLLLKTNQPTDIVVRNMTPDATSIHWHGIEIEGYSDGVVGVGGYAHMPIPPIMPGDSFVARVTVPRSGSFMYHTHVSDINQQGKGLAGPIVVVDDPATYDAVHERVFLVHSWLDVVKGQLGVEVNNDMKDSAPDTVQAGETYRLRFMNITLEKTGLRFRFASDKAPAVWTDVAKDGFELPVWQEVTGSDQRPVSIGETRDVTWEPLPGSSGWLELRGGGGGLVWRQRIEVVD